MADFAVVRRTALVLLVLSGAAADASAQYHDGYGGAEVIRCESRDYRQVYCGTDARGGARIVNQLSDTACIEGRTWGWDRRGVWVSGGCRGEFQIGSGRDRGRGRDNDYRESGSDEVVRCESRDYRQVYCNIDTRRGVNLVRQLSETACIEGRTWGSDRRGVWVSGGCRGEFALGRGSYGYDDHRGLPIERHADEPRRGVICESHDNRYRHCPTRIRRGADLVRQLSDKDCVYNRSWGYDANGLWVDRGCRGEFSVY
jgi:hypothetical protein